MPQSNACTYPFQLMGVYVTKASLCWILSTIDCRKSIVAVVGAVGVGGGVENVERKGHVANTRDANNGRLGPIRPNVRGGGAVQLVRHPTRTLLWPPQIQQFRQQLLRRLGRQFLRE